MKTAAIRAATELCVLDIGGGEVAERRVLNTY